MTGCWPFVEMSFMPRALAASEKPHAFWYRPLPSPPKDYAKWGELVYNFAKHLVDRYGINEVSQWYFEVWNEPNIDFWTGEPKEATYFELYDHAAKAVKRADQRLRVGGPASAQAAWIPEMIEHSVQTKVPLDFVSTHVYWNR
jgi:xylan 1,4-beta-xylosidase